jgi:hypothetical protein
MGYSGTRGTHVQTTERKLNYREDAGELTTRNMSDNKTDNSGTFKMRLGNGAVAKGQLEQVIAEARDKLEQMEQVWRANESAQDTQLCFRIRNNN